MILEPSGGMQRWPPTFASGCFRQQIVYVVQAAVGLNPRELRRLAAEYVSDESRL